MTNQHIKALAVAMLVLTLAPLGLAEPLLDADEIGFGGATRADNYDQLLESYFQSDNIIMTINDDLMWVPWYKTSSNSRESDLQDGNNCNTGNPIDFEHNCMVTDEFSQVGVLVGMGKNQERMDQFYNTVKATKSTFGDIPSWRVYRNGNTIESCKEGINSNCDTASDATARIVISLFAAAKNPYFKDEVQKQKYMDLAVKLSNDMLEYEIDNTCRKTYYGESCYWLAGGSNVKNAGIGASDYAYTGYYPDAIIAMLQAYANTNDDRFLKAAKGITLNYLQAAKFDGTGLRVPPGKSFRWVVDSNGMPQAECTNTCSPVTWDSYDASRALGMCQAKYYADEMGVTLPLMEKYCQILTDKHMKDPSSAPVQFEPDGTPGSYWSGYYAQGLQSLHQMGGNPDLFEATLDDALAHYNPSTRTFDSVPSMGVYTSAFAVRALGVGIGRDLPSFNVDGSFVDVIGDIDETIDPIVDETTEDTVTEDTQTEDPAQEKETSQETGSGADASGIADYDVSAVYGASGKQAVFTKDVTSGVCRELSFDTNKGAVEIFSCEKSGGYAEAYVRAAPVKMEFEVCIAGGCVSNHNGFARFIPEVTVPEYNEPSTDTQEPANDPVVEEPVGEDVVTETPSADETTKDTADDSSGVTSAISDYEAYATYDEPRKKMQLIKDISEGACRELSFDADGRGIVDIFACEKSDGYVEINLRDAPEDLHFEACVADGCVSSYHGFARFIPGVEQSEKDQSPSEKGQSPSEQSQAETGEEPAQRTFESLTHDLVFASKDVDMSLVKDEISGECREIIYDTSAGRMKVLTCDKGDGIVELYRQQYPQGVDFKFCLEEACLDKYAGFAKLQI